MLNQANTSCKIDKIAGHLRINTQTGSHLYLTIVSEFVNGSLLRSEGGICLIHLIKMLHQRRKDCLFK